MNRLLDPINAESNSSRHSTQLGDYFGDTGDILYLSNGYCSPLIPFIENPPLSKRTWWFGQKHRPFGSFITFYVLFYKCTGK